MGAHGTAISAEAADVVLLVDDISRVGDAMAISRRMRRIALQSIMVGLAASFVLMVIASQGLLAPPVGAVLQAPEQRARLHGHGSRRVTPRQSAAPPLVEARHQRIHLRAVLGEPRARFLRGGGPGHRADCQRHLEHSLRVHAPHAKCGAVKRG